MGVSWNPDFLYTVPGMAMAAQVVRKKKPDADFP